MLDGNLSDEDEEKDTRGNEVQPCTSHRNQRAGAHLRCEGGLGCCVRGPYRGTSLIRNTHPLRTTIGR